MNKMSERQDGNQYRHRFDISRFFLGSLLLVALAAGISLVATTYIQGVADRVTGYVDRPDYVTYKDKNAALSFEYPSTLTAKSSEESPNYVVFEQQDIDSRILKSNETQLNISLLSSDQIDGYQMTKEGYYETETADFYSDIAEQTGSSDCPSCSTENKEVNGTDLLILRSKERSNYVDYEIRIWNESWTGRLDISGTSNDINADYIDHIISTIKVGK